MAIINDKKEFVKAVGVIVEADLGVENLLFPTMRLQTKELIEYDVATVEAESPAYNSFRNTANVVSKDGKDRVVVAPSMSLSLKRLSMLMLKCSDKMSTEMVRSMQLCNLHLLVLESLD